MHFEAPAAEVLDNEMEAFIDWFNRPDDTDWVVRSAMAHLCFVAIHPFDDGNGLIARALTDTVLPPYYGAEIHDWHNSRSVP